MNYSLLSFRIKKEPLMTAIYEGIAGFGAGYQYATAKSKEDEVKQGKNYYLAAAPVIGQVGLVGLVTSKLSELFPQHPLSLPTRILSNVVPVLNIPFALLCAAVKQGDYNDIAAHINNWGKLPFSLPVSLGERSVKVLSFFAEHAGNMARVAMLAGSVALIVLGNVYFGGAVLAAVGYEAIDQMGLIPRKVSLFMERYLPTVSLIGLLIGGTFFNRLGSALILPTYLFSSFNDWLNQKVDWLARKFFNIQGPTVIEIDAPLTEKKELNFTEIQQILNGNPYDYEINPAHCSKWVADLNQLPTNYNFDTFQTLFDEIDWTARYAVVLGQLRDDDRFIDFLSTKFEKVKEKIKAEREEVRNRTKEAYTLVDSYIQSLAAEANVSKEEFAAKWLKEQMEELIQVLKGEKRVKGSQCDLDDAISDCAKLVPYAVSLKQERNDLDLESILLKLAVEGGGYCARGIKRATNELVGQLLQHGKTDQENDDPIKSYEIRLKQSLQDVRHRIVQEFYQDIVKLLHIPNAIAQDTHGFDLYRIFLSLGFYPLTAHERNQIGVGEIGVWELYADARTGMYRLYQRRFADAISQAGGIVIFSAYIRGLINQNQTLSPEEKERIVSQMVTWNDDSWTGEEMMERFQRLAFVMLGVLRPRAN
jgi:hypothetical protein